MITKAPQTKKPKAEDTKAKIVKAAASLFQAEGIRDVSVDAIAAKAGITKRSFYYHFPSKDQVIEAYLEGRDQPNFQQFQLWFNQCPGSLPEKVKAIFDNLGQSIRHPKWKGCGFLRTSVELVRTPGHPAMIAGRAHKRRVEDWLSAEFAAHLPENIAHELGRQIVLLMDGAFAVVLLHRDPGYMESAGLAAKQLIAGQLADHG